MMSMLKKFVIFIEDETVNYSHPQKIMSKHFEKVKGHIVLSRCWITILCFYVIIVSMKIIYK